jgi:hypothetical protein
MVLSRSDVFSLPKFGKCLSGRRVGFHPISPDGFSGHDKTMNNNNFSTIKPAEARPISRNPTLYQTQRDVGPSKDEIAKKAYSIYQARGCPQGLDLQHWLEAETCVIGERNLSRIQN